MATFRCGNMRQVFESGSETLLPEFCICCVKSRLVCHTVADLCCIKVTTKVVSCNVDFKRPGLKNKLKRYCKGNGNLLKKFWKAWMGLGCLVNFGNQNFLNISTMISFETFWHFLPEIPRSKPSTELPPKKQEFRCVHVYGYF